MSRYPGAIWEPVAYRSLARRQPKRAALLHTNGSKGTDLKGWWDSCAAGKQGPSMTHVGAQYQVLQDGTAYCYVDPDYVVYHAFSASTWAFAIETQDGGNPATPWTAAQIETIAQILHFHGVPPQMLAGSGPGDGIGYHQQQQDWNHSNHACPGATRRAQIPLVLARVAALASAPSLQTPTTTPTTTTEDDLTPEEHIALGAIEQMVRQDHITLGTILNQLLPGLAQQQAKTAAVLASLGGADDGPVDTVALAAALAERLGATLAAAVAAQLVVQVKA